MAKRTNSKIRSFWLSVTGTGAVQGAEGGEALTRRAASEKVEVASTEVERPHQLDGSHSRMSDLSSRTSLWFSCVSFGSSVPALHRGENGEPGALQPDGQATAAAEQIERRGPGGPFGFRFSRILGSRTPPSPQPAERYHIAATRAIQTRPQGPRFESPCTLQPALFTQALLLKHAAASRPPTCLVGRDRPVRCLMATSANVRPVPGSFWPERPGLRVRPCFSYLTSGMSGTRAGACTAAAPRKPATTSRPASFSTSRIPRTSRFWRHAEAATTRSPWTRCTSPA